MSGGWLTKSCLLERHTARVTLDRLAVAKETLGKHLGSAAVTISEVILLTGLDG